MIYSLDTGQTEDDAFNSKPIDPELDDSELLAGESNQHCFTMISHDRIPSTTPGAEPPRDAKDSGSARPHSTHPETSSTNRP